MAAGWYAHRLVLLLTAAGLAGAVAGWLARSRRPATSGPSPAVPSGPTATTRGPSPLPGPVPLSEGTAVDAPYTDEEPYTGRPRYAPATSRRGTDVPGGTPP
ncbi:hypothetical protein GA0074692_5687 [Micromonospora pallida]|uniref:Uncharacterized protein n=1 Tax=Micromonospora pallida TaxID=145854 RepID=A0A1C6TEL3_9ACTN|nr:hypothetical protein [Micromonospora pallida]SCL40228.1 hypothetical protein GA0074692_5687 [Micromonospora pallida]